MLCSEFLVLSSEFRDGEPGRPLEGELLAHLQACPGCRRYQVSLEKGVDLLRSFPTLNLAEDFKPRLSHRIYHLEDGAGISRDALGSGATTVSVLAVAVLLALAAWTPRSGVVPTSLDLPAVVVGVPPARSFTPSPRRSNFSRSPSFFTSADFQDGPWGDTHQLLFEYSSLSERRRALVLSRVGIQ